MEPWQQAIVERDRRRRAALEANLHLFRPVLLPEAPAVAAEIFFPGVPADAGVLRIAAKIADQAIDSGVEQSGSSPAS